MILYLFAMTYQTHAYFGQVLFSCISEVWNADISEKQLIIGSVKPDRSSLFLSHPHFWNYSKNFVYKRIKKLSHKKIVSGKKNKKFSMELGIVLHYIADFFTAVHNISPNKVLEHMAYEEKLHKAFLEQITVEKVKQYARSALLLNPERKLENCIAELRIRHAVYKPSRDNPDNDIREILNASFLVLSFVLGAVLEEKEMKKKAV